MRKSFPDLRADHNEFTAEHCSVLLHKLGKLLDQMYGSGMADVDDQVDSEQMREDLLGLFSANQLSKLFETDLGKGLIIGIFFSQCVLPLIPKDE